MIAKSPASYAPSLSLVRVYRPRLTRIMTPLPLVAPLFGEICSVALRKLLIILYVIRNSFMAPNKLGRGKK